MKTKDITENNKLTAEFIGMKPSKIFGKYSISKDHCTCNEDTPDKAMNGFASIAKYNTSWDWLMPVVEEIEKLIFNDDIYYEVRQLGGTIVSIMSSDGDELIYIDNEDSRLKSAYRAVVEFIKWYNEERPTVRCNNCYWVGREDDLQTFVDMGENIGKEINYYKGCPNCKTDDYLMDI